MRIELYGNASINTEQGFLKVNGNYDFGNTHMLFFLTHSLTHIHTQTHIICKLMNQSLFD